MIWTEVGNAVAAGAAVAAAVTAAWQPRRTRNEALDARAAEIASVTVVPEIVERPTKEDHLAGNRVWLIKYHLHNPGRLPISNVHAVVTFPCKAQRHHYDGTPDALLTATGRQAIGAVRSITGTGLGVCQTAFKQCRSEFGSLSLSLSQGCRIPSDTWV